MGLLYTTEGTRRMLDTLNTAFDASDNGLKYIRSLAPPGSKLEDMLKKQNWAPGHLAAALKLYPYDQSPNPQPLDPQHVKRWAYFLKKVVGNQQFKDIKQKLAEAILEHEFRQCLVPSPRRGRRFVGHRHACGKQPLTAPSRGS